MDFLCCASLQREPAKRTHRVLHLPACCSSSSLSLYFTQMAKLTSRVEANQNQKYSFLWREKLTRANSFMKNAAFKKHLLCVSSSSALEAFDWQPTTAVWHLEFATQERSTGRVWGGKVPIIRKHDPRHYDAGPNVTPWKKLAAGRCEWNISSLSACVTQNLIYTKSKLSL